MRWSRCAKEVAVSADVHLSYERIGLDGTVRILAGVEGEEPHADRVDVFCAEDRERCVDELRRRWPGLDPDEMHEALRRFAAEVEADGRAGLMRDTANRARSLGLLPYQIVEAYRRAVARTLNPDSPWTAVDAAAALGGVDGADENDVVRILEGDEDRIRGAFRKAGGSADEVMAPQAAGMGALLELGGVVIPVSWQVSAQRSSGTGTLQTPVHSDRLSLQSSTRRRSVARRLLERHGLDAEDETLIESVDKLLTRLASLDADTQVAQSELPEAGNDATELIELVHSLGVELFHTPGGLDADCYAIIPVRGHREVWSLESRGFGRWVSHEFYRRRGRALSQVALSAAVNALVGEALFEGAENDVSVRLAGVGGRVYLDLANDERHAIEIDSNGWRRVDPIEKGVRFVRREGMLALPMPEQGGDLDALRELVNVPSDDDWILVKGFLVMSLHPCGPYPVLSINGEQGSAKSFLTRFVRTLVDPSDTALRRPPAREEDLGVAGRSSWIVAYENVSSLSGNMSDAICCLSTGGTLTRRRLYTNEEESRIRLKRPVIVNGIVSVALRGDLADRSIPLVLPRIRREERRLEQELLAAFDALHASLLGALLDAVSCALQRVANVRLDAMERMAEFCAWVTAAEPSLGIEDGAFMEAYRSVVEDAAVDALDASPVTAPVLELLARSPGREWVGTCKELLQTLDAKRGEKRPPRGWPQSPTAMGHALRRIAPLLRHRGVEMVEPASRERPRRYTLRLPMNDGTKTVGTDEPSGSVRQRPRSAGLLQPVRPPQPSDAGGMVSPADTSGGGSDGSPPAEVSAGIPPDEAGNADSRRSDTSDGSGGGCRHDGRSLDDAGSADRQTPSGRRTAPPADSGAAEPQGRPATVGSVGSVGDGPHGPVEGVRSPTVEVVQPSETSGATDGDGAGSALPGSEEPLLRALGNGRRPRHTEPDGAGPGDDDDWGEL